MPPTMGEAHTRDSAAEREFRRLARDIDEFLNSEHAHGLNSDTRRSVEVAAQGLRKYADHLVAVWD